ncbi:AraC family transcriptional regulator [Azospirillum argentinense]|uniref:AraC family transcriptional regulator n=1 Tax=Azospirillum argentinense TaxID=2970906 RepID=A0A060DEI5_9PROT|nr:DJ-1/PfpI family protein [Azospirillum argentinense]AIB11115.1 AraC family transcriptional regulator [Azospirillum argentinense]EZQ08066.1 dimethylglycine dehydrogenase [Azospirillum argentinense]
MTENAPSFGLLLFPNVTQLDLTGPYEVLARVPGAKVHLLWKTLDPVRSDTGLTILPTATLAEAPPLDLLLVPGGSGINALLTDEEVLTFLAERAAGTRYLSGICTGSLVLAAAGLLEGRRAGTHWASRDFLSSFGAVPVAKRVVVDGTLFTGGGVTAGIDVALRIVGELFGADAAKRIQLSIEYDPQPPFNAGSPDGAGEVVTADLLARMRPILEARAAAVAAGVDALRRRRSARAG